MGKSFFDRLFLLEDYHQYGAYINSEDIVEVNGEGSILWGQTIDNGFALISNNRPCWPFPSLWTGWARF